MAGSIESLGILPQPLPGSGASFKPGLSALGGVAAGRGNLQPAGGQRNLRSRGEDDEGEGGPTRSGPVALGQGPPHAGTNFRPHLQHCSLFHLLNRTRTAAGARLLRGSLLQPLITPEAIELRYDAVGELLDSREMAADVGQVRLDVNMGDAGMTACMSAVHGSLSLAPLAFAYQGYAAPAGTAGTLISAGMA
jgi:hypothetical protein